MPNLGEHLPTITPHRRAAIGGAGRSGMGRVRGSGRARADPPGARSLEVIFVMAIHYRHPDRGGRPARPRASAHTATTPNCCGSGALHHSRLLVEWPLAMG